MDKAIQMNYWRIVAGHPREPSEEIDSESIHLGDWLRRSYISIGNENVPAEQAQISRKRFYEEMQIGDKVAVTTDGYLWALGEITSEVYDKQEKYLYDHRRDVVWYNITKENFKSYPQSLESKLSNPNTLMPLDSNDWDTLVAYL